jgi:phosphomevalonate kinase
MSAILRAAQLVPKLQPVLSTTNSAWDYKVEPFQLPPSTRLMLADVDAGSDTPSLVSKVLKWRQAEPTKGRRTDVNDTFRGTDLCTATAAEVWNALNQTNMAFAKALSRLSTLHGEDPEDYDFVARFAASLQPVQVGIMVLMSSGCRI